MGSYITKLELDDKDFAPKAKQAQQAIAAISKEAQAQNEREARHKAVKKELADTAQRQRKEAEGRKPIEDQINAALEKRERLQRLIARAGENTLRKDSLELSLRKTNDELRTLREKGGDSLGALINQVPFLSRGLSITEGILAKLSGRFGTLSAIGGGALALASLLRNKIGSSQGLEDAAFTANVSTSRVRAIGFGAQGAGADPAAVFNTIGDVRKNQGAALSGRQEQARAFEQLGISAKQLRSLNADELTFKIFDRLKSGTTTAEEYSAALKVLGEGSKTLIPAIQRDLGGLVKSFEQSSLAVSEGTTKSLAEAGNAWDRFKAKADASTDSFWTNLAGGFVSLGQLAKGAAADFVTTFTGQDGRVARFRDEQLLARELALGNQAGEDGTTKAKADRLAAIDKARDAAAFAGAAAEGQSLNRKATLMEAIKQKEFEGLDEAAQKVKLLQKQADIMQAISDLAEDEQQQTEDYLTKQGELLDIKAAIKQLGGNVDGLNIVPAGQEFEGAKAAREAQRVFDLQKLIRDKEFEGLDANQQKVELLRRQAALQADIVALKADEQDNTPDFFQKQADLLDVKAQLKQLSPPPNTDALTRIGGFQSSILSPAQTSGIKSQLQHIVDATAQTNIHLAKLVDPVGT